MNPTAGRPDTIAPEFHRFSRTRSNLAAAWGELLQAGALTPAQVRLELDATNSMLHQLAELNRGKRNAG